MKNRKRLVSGSTSGNSADLDFFMRWCVVREHGDRIFRENNFQLFIGNFRRFFFHARSHLDKKIFSYINLSVLYRFSPRARVFNPKEFEITTTAPKTSINSRLALLFSKCLIGPHGSRLFPLNSTSESLTPTKPRFCCS